MAAVSPGLPVEPSLSPGLLLVDDADADVGTVGTCVDTAVLGDSGAAGASESANGNDDVVGADAEPGEALTAPPNLSAPGGTGAGAGTLGKSFSNGAAGAATLGNPASADSGNMPGVCDLGKVELLLSESLC
jgi:hypothetical protein